MRGHPVASIRQDRRIARSLLAIAIGVVVLPPALSVYWAYRSSLEHAQEMAALVTTQVLHRVDDIGAQMRRGLSDILQPPRPAPCSAASIERMRHTLLQLDLLVDIGYIHDNVLVCSAFGRHETPVGKPSYTSQAGFSMRNPLRLPGSDATLVGTTDPASGVTLVAHASNALNIIPTDQPWDITVVGHGQRDVVLARRGEFRQHWLELSRRARAGSTTDANYLISWERPTQGAYTVFVAQPRSLWARTWISTALKLGTLGLAIGIMLLMAVLRIARTHVPIRSLLRRAIHDRQLHLEYQPVVELASGRWVGAEALLRWHRPNGEIISPAVFIPIAEKSGMMPLIRERVIDLFEKDAPALFAHAPDFHVALNFCAEDFHAPSSLPDRLQAALRVIGANPRNLHVELTETVFTDADTARPAIDALQAAGIGVAIDDFGTGYSSLSHLSRVKFDYLKIDRSFIDTIGTDAVTSQITNAIIDMAKSLDIRMIAEGVETREQAAYLADHGVEYAQGWLYSRSLPMKTFLRKLQEQDGPRPRVWRRTA